MLNNFVLATLDALSAHIALVDSDGNIIAVNEAWRRFAEDNAARSNVSEGANYFATCANTQGRDVDYASNFAAGLKAVIAGQKAEFALEYPCHSPQERRWFMGRISRFTTDSVTYAVVAHENITERKLAEENLYLQAKAAALIEERQRISRELHDGVNQALFSSVSIAQSLPRIFAKDTQRAASLLDEVIKYNRAALSEMRILLNELRPESLVNTALPTLLQQLVGTVTNRLGAKVTFVVNGAETQLAPAVHFAIYRMAQEAINNILKHSEAEHVAVTLTYELDSVCVEIVDNGCGFDLRTTSRHIGLSSMRERAAEINASLDVVSIPGQGTQVCITWVQPADD